MIEIWQNSIPNILENNLKKISKNSKMLFGSQSSQWPLLDMEIFIQGHFLVA